MRSFTITTTTTLLLAALGRATPTPVQHVGPRQDESFPYPIVATYQAVMRDVVDADYVAFLEESVVIRLDEPVSLSADMTRRDEGGAAGVKERQTGTCDIQGFAIVSGQLTPFQGTVTNSAANFGRAVTLTGVLQGCSIGLIPQSNCGLWSITDTSGCATSRSVSFS